MIPATHTITDTIAVASPQHLSEVLREASDRRTPVILVGGGTCISTGNASDSPYLALDLSGLSGIDDYVPTDMTASFRAGTSVRSVREALAADGQELPLDLADDDSGTIGGLVATGFSGPRRLGQGTLKDLIIGCEYVRGDGLLAKAGGMTVKNVSGFEIGRMLHGSWGSLAVLTRINMKLLPMPRAECTLVWSDTSLASALERQRTLLAHLPTAISVQSTQDARGVSTHARFVGRASAVDAYLERAADHVGPPDTVSTDRRNWVLPRASGSAPIVVCSASIAEIEQLAIARSRRDGTELVRVSLGTGTCWIQINPERINARDLTTDVPGMWTLEGGDPAWKQHVNVWGPTRPDRVVATAIKQQFDPAGILNSGRLFL